METQAEVDALFAHMRLPLRGGCNDEFGS